MDANSYFSKLLEDNPDLDYVLYGRRPKTVIELESYHSLIQTAVASSWEFEGVDPSQSIVGSSEDDVKWFSADLGRPRSGKIVPGGIPQSLPWDDAVVKALAESLAEWSDDCPEPRDCGQLTEAIERWMGGTAGAIVVEEADLRLGKELPVYKRV